MNDQLQQALSSIVTKSISGIDTGVDFLGREIPDVIRQLLMFKAVYAAVELVILVVCITAIGLFAKVMSKALAQEKRGFFHDGYGVSVMAAVTAIVLGILSIVFVVAAFADLQTLFNIWLAPKIYLIGYAAKLAGK